MDNQDSPNPRLTEKGLRRYIDTMVDELYLDSSGRRTALETVMNRVLTLAGMTVTDVATLLGMNRSTLGSRLNKQNALRLDRPKDVELVERICRAIGFDPALALDTADEVEILAKSRNYKIPEHISEQVDADSELVFNDISASARMIRSFITLRAALSLFAHPAVTDHIERCLLEPEKFSLEERKSALQAIRSMVDILRQQLSVPVNTENSVKDV